MNYRRLALTIYWICYLVILWAIFIGMLIVLWNDWSNPEIIIAWTGVLGIPITLIIAGAVYCQARRESQQTEATRLLQTNL